jgi:hypothetical protein
MMRPLPMPPYFLGHFCSIRFELKLLQLAVVFLELNEFKRRTRQAKNPLIFNSYLSSQSKYLVIYEISLLGIIYCQLTLTKFGY